MIYHVLLPHVCVIATCVCALLPHVCYCHLYYLECASRQALLSSSSTLWQWPPTQYCHTNHFARNQLHWQISVLAFFFSFLWIIYVCGLWSPHFAVFKRNNLSHSTSPYPWKISLLPFSTVFLELWLAVSFGASSTPMVVDRWSYLHATIRMYSDSRHKQRTCYF